MANFDRVHLTFAPLSTQITTVTYQFGASHHAQENPAEPETVTLYGFLVTSNLSYASTQKNSLTFGEINAIIYRRKRMAKEVAIDHLNNCIH